MNRVEVYAIGLLIVAAYFGYVKGYHGGAADLIQTAVILFAIGEVIRRIKKN